MNRLRALALAFFALSSVSACGDGGGDDPRCVALCGDPSLSEGDSCSEASVEGCYASCNARIRGESNLCQTCLLEDARFGDGPGISDFCEGGSPECALGPRCERRGCFYCMGDDAARQACVEMTGREVSCDTDFRPVAECAGLCGG